LTRPARPLMRPSSLLPPQPSRLADGVTKALARTAVKRMAWELRTLAGRSPFLCRWLLHRSGEVATAETEICIEGFPRSGNTFAVIAFQQAQTRTVSIAHHVHAPGSVIGAARRRK